MKQENSAEYFKDYDTKERRKEASPWGGAKRRALIGMPYAKEILDAINHIRSSSGITEEERGSERIEMAPMYEARYLLTDHILKTEEPNIKQFLEVASGMSGRGLHMTNSDPAVKYSEVDRPEITAGKQQVLDYLYENNEEIGHRSNLTVYPGYATDMQSLKNAVQNFEQKPVAIINEGLLRYLDIGQRKIYARHIHALLGQYGGVWITPDINLKEQAPGLNDNPAGSYSEDLENKIRENAFVSVEEARKFFEGLGFEVEIHSFMEIKDQLISPQKLNLNEGEVQKLIGNRVTFVMRANNKNTRRDISSTE